jgi:FkbM family methyltransferase
MELVLFKIYRAIFGRKMFYNFNRLLYRCSLSGMGVLNYENDIVSGERKFLAKRVSTIKNAVVFDVGANIGDYTKAVLSVNRDASVYAFEPHPVTYTRLCQNLEGRNVALMNVAVGDAEGDMLLYDYESQDGSAHASVYRDVIENIHKKKSLSHSVKVLSVDDFSAKNDIENIALLKIDTEGNEFSVLRGAKNMIARGSIDMIHFEFNEMNVSSRTFFRDFWDMLADYNFYRLLGSGMVKLSDYSPVYCEIFAFQNIVAIRKDTDLL